MSTLFQKIWVEQELPDYIKANLLAAPDDVIIRSATSNYQRRPSWLVLVDHKYPLTNLVSVDVERSRKLSANTATIVLRNVECRYSGPNQYKVAANIPVSIYAGFEDHYIQRFEGYIDKTSLRTAENSTVTIECRDKAKPLLDQKISAGIFSKESEYLGWNDWHFEPKRNTSTHKLVKFGKAWTFSEIIVDILYNIGLKDLGNYIVVDKETAPSGEELYTRRVVYRPDFDIQIPQELDVPSTANFVEEKPLDCLSKLVQAVLCEAYFDECGRFIVRPMRDNASPSSFYLKEERDIVNLQVATDDDNIANIATVIGQTANETAVTYPFAAIAAKDDIALEKAQDIYGYTLTYPDCVGPENWSTLKKPSIYAPVVSPNGVFPNYKLNPENTAKYDTMMHYPTFANPFKKQIVLEGSYQLITSGADDATSKNTRQWYFHGETEEANQHEPNPIFLYDRFGKPLRVVHKGRQEGVAPPPDPDKEKWIKVEVNVETVNRTIEANTEDGSGVVDASQIVIEGVPIQNSSNRWIANGLQWRNFSGADLPPILDSIKSDINRTFKVVHTEVRKKGTGTTDYSAAVQEYLEEVAIFQATDIKANASKPETLVAFGPIVDETRISGIQYFPNPSLSLDVMCENCTLEYDQVEGTAKILPKPPTGQIGSFTMKYPIVFIKSRYFSPQTAVMYNEHIYAYSYFELKMALDFVSQTMDAASKLTNPPLMFRVFTKNGVIEDPVDPNDEADRNCIYWRWYGPMEKDKPLTDTRLNPIEITKSEFYKEAADPLTVVVEVLSDSYDGKAASECIAITEEYMKVYGTNQYGDMSDVTAEFAETLQTALLLIMTCIISLAISVCNWWVAGAIVALTIYAYDMIGDMADLGRNISRQLVPVEGKVWGGRQTEITQVYNAQHAYMLHWDWRAKLRDETYPGSGIKLSDTYPTFPTDYNFYDHFIYTEDGGDIAYVFVFDVGSGNDNSEILNPANPTALITALGWETPEVGDRSLIDYYAFRNVYGEEIPVRIGLVSRFKIEAFGNLDTLQKRFCDKYGVTVEPDDDWSASVLYEPLVDRSQADIAITDYGLWYDFWERREDYYQRRYRFITLTIYKWQLSMFLNPNQNPTNEPDPDPIDMIRVINENPSTFNPEIFFCANGYGFFVPRGLDSEHYVANKRWLADRREHNAATIRPLHLGQNTLVAHLYNNFAWNPVKMAIRIWGKAFGKFAPTVIAYSESDTLSIDSYGNREVVLTNPCINNFKTAKWLAEHLATGAIRTFDVEVTGKGYINEGDIVTIKEESSGAIAGTFRTWENTFISPAKRSCAGIANQLVTQELEGISSPAYSSPTAGNYTLMCSGDSTQPGYVLEVDTNCNPVWYAQLATGHSAVAFAIRTSEPNSKTIVGLKNRQTIAVLDRPDTNLVDRYNVLGMVNGGSLTDDYEQRFLFVATSIGIACIDYWQGMLVFSQGVGATLDVACGVWKGWREEVRDNIPMYDLCGVVLALTPTGIKQYQMFKEFDYTLNNPSAELGDLKETYTSATIPGLTFNNPSRIEYSRSLNEIIYVDGETSTTPAIIYGLEVEILHEADYPDLFEFHILGIKWKIDYSDDAELCAKFPNRAQRIAYIQQFFSPVHAIRDVNRDVIITDSKHNKVYRVNPTGKFYVVSVKESFTRSDSSDKYTATIKAIPVDCAMSTQLTNFGVNFLQSKTEEQVEEEKSTSMGRIVGTLPREKYLVRLLTSGVVVKANNSSNEQYKVNDTVLVVKGFGGNYSFTIIGRKDLNDWVVETGEPYTIVDATQVDVTKYGEILKSGATSEVDLTSMQTQLNIFDTRLRQLAKIHGINW